MKTILHVILASLLINTLLFSCKNEAKSIFHKDITYSQLLNKTDFFSFESVDTYKIRYKSDGLIIEGFIAKPNQYKFTTKLPVIIYCRGGNQSFGMIGGSQLKYVNYLASQGYVVLASQLRGNIASEGKDEFGGKDVNDILKLIEIAKELDFVNVKNIHVLGYSRGGMNAYQVSKLTDNINSLAVVGGSTTLFNQYNFRPRMYHGVIKPLVGDSVIFKEEYIKRSAIYWSNKINEPTLILHGDNDESVLVDEANQLVDSFKLNNKKNFEYKIFEAGNHGLSNFKKERNDLIFNWFKTHNK